MGGEGVEVHNGCGFHGREVEEGKRWSNHNNCWGSEKGVPPACSPNGLLSFMHMPKLWFTIFFKLKLKKNTIFFYVGIRVLNNFRGWFFKRLKILK